MKVTMRTLPPDLNVLAIIHVPDVPLKLTMYTMPPLPLKSPNYLPDMALQAEVDMPALYPPFEYAIVSAAPISIEEGAIKPIKTFDVTSLSTAAIGQLTPVQVEALCSGQISALSTEQVSALYPGEIHALRTTHLAALTPETVQNVLNVPAVSEEMMQPVTTFKEQKARRNVLALVARQAPLLSEEAQAALPHPVIAHLFFMVERLEGYSEYNSDLWGSACHKLIEALEEALWSEPVVKHYGHKLTVYDRSTNGVKVDGRAIGQVKGNAAMKILRQTFRRLRIQTGVEVFGLDLYSKEQNPSFKITFDMGNGIIFQTYTDDDTSMIRPSDPTGSFTLNGVKYKFFMMHPHLSLTAALAPAFRHALVTGCLWKLTTAMNNLGNNGSIADVELDELRIK